MDKEEPTLFIVLSSLGFVMTKRKLLYLAIIPVAIVFLVTGLYGFKWVSRMHGQPQPRATVDMDISYLPVSKSVSSYYRLGIESGALVTEVKKGSPYDSAGIKPGDVIVSFNGIAIDDETPLFGVLRSCSDDENVTMEVWNASTTRTITISR
jgi:S1-C subfamily serine protease